MKSADPPRSLKKLAVFDIDGTIFRSSLLIELVEECVREKVFKPSVVRAYERERIQWLDRRGGYEQYLMGVIAVFRKNLRGVFYEDFARAAKRAARLNKNRVYRFTRDLVRTLVKRSYWLVAVSHSPRGIVESFAKHMGFNKTYGILYELDGAKKFTGRIMHGDNIYDKASIVRRILEKEPVTLRGSVGVGDTESDISFLKLVDRPICFNPNQKLFAFAKRRRWEIVVERKDVVYRIRRRGEDGGGEPRSRNF